MLLGVDGAAAQTSDPTLGAKLGAILCGHVWTAVDAGGIEGLPFRAVWTAVDACGQRLEIYGSEGWGFGVPPGVLLISFLRSHRPEMAERYGRALRKKGWAAHSRAAAG